MSDELDLDAIETRATRATPGPWEGFERVGKVTKAIAPWTCIVLSMAPGYHQTTPEDVAFIAAARQDVPKLVVEVRRQRAEIDVLREKIEDLYEELSFVQGQS